MQMFCKPNLGGREEHARQLTKQLNQLGERLAVLTLDAGARDESEFDADGEYKVLRFQFLESYFGGRVVDYLLRKHVMFREVFVATWRVKPAYVVPDEMIEVSWADTVL